MIFTHFTKLLLSLTRWLPKDRGVKNYLVGVIYLIYQKGQENLWV
jgi:hypothetical protein